MPFVPYQFSHQSEAMWLSMRAQYGAEANLCSAFERPLHDSLIHGMLALFIVLSHVPQWLRQHRSDHRKGMSMASALMAAVISTEHLALTVISYTHPLSVSSCLRSTSVLGKTSIIVTLLQPTLLWLCCMIQFLSVLGVQSRPFRFTAILAPYIGLFLLPVVWFPPLGLDDGWSRWAVVDILRPVATMLCILHPLAQLSTLGRFGAVEARSGLVLSRSTTKLQIATFACLSMGWSLRISPPMGDYTIEHCWNWYVDGGWVVVNFAALSVGQWLVLRRLDILKTTEQWNDGCDVGHVKGEKYTDAKPILSA